MHRRTGSVLGWPLTLEVAGRLVTRTADRTGTSCEGNTDPALHVEWHL